VVTQDSLVHRESWQAEVRGNPSCFEICAMAAQVAGANKTFPFLHFPFGCARALRVEVSRYLSECHLILPNNREVDILRPTRETMHR